MMIPTEMPKSADDVTAYTILTQIFDLLGLTEEDRAALYDVCVAERLDMMTLLAAIIGAARDMAADRRAADAQRRVYGPGEMFDTTEVPAAS